MAAEVILQMLRFSAIEKKFIFSMLLPVMLITVAWLVVYGLFSYHSSKLDQEARRNNYGL